MIGEWSGERRQINFLSISLCIKFLTELCPRHLSDDLGSPDNDRWMKEKWL